jgi:hypothetical protein
MHGRAGSGWPAGPLHPAATGHLAGPRPPRGWPGRPQKQRRASHHVLIPYQTVTAHPSSDLLTGTAGHRLWSHSLAGTCGGSSSGSPSDRPTLERSRADAFLAFTTPSMPSAVDTRSATPTVTSRAGPIRSALLGQGLPFLGGDPRDQAGAASVAGGEDRGLALPD